MSSSDVDLPSPNMESDRALSRYQLRNRANVAEILGVVLNDLLVVLSVDLEQVITLSLALLLAAKYVFFEQAETESSLSIKSSVATPSCALTNRRAAEDRCQRELAPPKALKTVQINKGEPDIPFFQLSSIMFAC